MLALAGSGYLYASSEPASAEILPDGAWFRWEAHFTVKETGENITVSKVIPCNGAPVLKVNVNGQEMLAGFGGVGIHAKVTSRRNAIMVDVPSGRLVCPGGRPITTENSPSPGSVNRYGWPKSYVPKDYLPKAVWFDDADDLRFGVMYPSEAAYENPNAKIAFKGATISSATKDDFIAWREEERTSFRPSKVIVRPEGFLITEVQSNYKEGSVPADRRLATTCFAAFRFMVPAEIKPLVTRAWPTDKPKYWMGNHSGDRAAYQELVSALSQSRTEEQVLFDGFPLRAYTGKFDTNYHGLPTRNGTGQIRGNLSSAEPYEARRPAVHYPVISELMDQNISPDLGSTGVVVRTNILFKPEYAGFAFCYSGNHASVELTPENALKAPGVTLSTKRNVCRINGTDIALSMQPTPRVADGTQCIGNGRSFGDRIIFEEDEAVWVHVGWAMI